MRELAELLDPGSRVIEVSPPGVETATYLAASGYERYLGLVLPARLPTVRDGAGDLSHRFQPFTDATAATNNDTDILILNGRSVRAVWRSDQLRHVRYVALEAGIGATAVEGRLARTFETRAGRLRPLGPFRCGRRRFDVVEVVDRRQLAVRRYLSPVLGTEGLVRRLESADLRYAVLRWFEPLPELQPGEDLDILVADEDLDKFRTILEEEPGTTPVDLYSVSGAGHADYKGIAYYPPELAERILDRAVEHESGYRVPAPDDHLHSLAYHALYHKGERSGIPSSIVDHGADEPEHDYMGELERLAGYVEVALPGSLEGIDEYLEDQGWRPPLDTRIRLSSSNTWLEARLAADVRAAVDPPELTIFVLRARATDPLDDPELVDVLDHFGFEVVALRDLDEATRERCVSQMRGGNWGAGPYPESGGPPARVLVTVHYGPRRPDPDLQAQYPLLSNTETLAAKRRVRRLINDRLPPDQRCNPIHSSDNEVEAWHYLQLTLPGEAARLRSEVEERRDEYRTTLPVVEELSRGRRAKVELVSYQGELAVKKTFGRGYGRHMDRELRAFAQLGPAVTAVPALLETGPNWFLCPYYDDALSDHWGSGRLLPLRVVREMVAVLREIHDLGFSLVDAKPENFVLDPQDGLRIIDFEFLHEHGDGSSDLASSYTFVGFPDDFAGDVPVGPWGEGPARSSTYDWEWLHYTGLSLDSLLHRPPWRQRIERTRFRLMGSVPDERVPLRTIRDGLRRAFLGLRGYAARSYRTWAWSRVREM